MRGSWKRWAGPILGATAAMAIAGCASPSTDDGAASSDGNLSGIKDRGFYPQVGRVEFITGAAAGKRSVICTATIVGAHTAVAVREGCAPATGRPKALDRQAALSAAAAEGEVVGAFFHGDHDQDLQLTRDTPRIIHPRTDSVPAGGGRAISSTFLSAIDRWESVNDVLVLHMRDAVPAEIMPARIDDRIPKKNDQLFAVGFTCPKATDPDSGNQRVDELYNWGRDGANAWDKFVIFMETYMGYMFGGGGSSAHGPQVDGKFEGVCLERDRGIPTLRREWEMGKPHAVVALLADQREDANKRVLANHVVVAGAAALRDKIGESER